ncbi:34448_t:CDS:2 [Gigaspora margarita]|uniref:34448_t:CDS:1 n=1 Tax=Gigaspora margarita TaxID=4874 RepID=A0ABN7VRQ6_GIGMA|nr:34448_t:CDS:2 [Gigaspora margarita]
MNSTKTFYFGNNFHENRTIVIKELLHPSYGCYIWPSAFVLAEYIWEKRDMFKDKTILELGAGTSLPGFLCASLSPQTHVILTDRSDCPQILENIHDGAQLNRLLVTSDDISVGTLRSNVWIRGLTWGEFCFGNQEKDKNGGNLLQLLRDIEQNDRKLDWILGSDTFYDPKDFEDIIATIAYILNYHAQKAKFLTSYQERSSKRTIQYLLDKWKLKCRQISLKSFDFDYDKYTNSNNSELNNDSINNTSEAACKKEMIYSSSLQSIFLLEIWKT